MSHFNPIGYINVSCDKVFDLADKYLARRRARIDRERMEFIEKKTGSKVGIFRKIISKEMAADMWSNDGAGGISHAWWAENRGSVWSDKITSLQNAAYHAMKEGIESMLVDAELYDVMNRGT